MVYDVFESRAASYDEWFYSHPVTAYNEVKAIDSLGEPLSPSLEIGVGSGFFASRLGLDYGLDPALSLLLIARERRVNVVRGVGEHPPFRKGVFRTVYVIVTLCFVDDPSTFIDGVGRVLRKEGFLVLCYIPLDSPWGRYYMEKGLRGESMFYEKARFYRKAEVESLLRGRGFRIIRRASTLTYGPRDIPFHEEPRMDDTGSFLCYKAVYS